MSEKLDRIDNEAASAQASLDDLVIEFDAPISSGPSNIQLDFEAKAKAPLERAIPRFASRPALGDERRDPSFRSPLSGDDAAAILERAEWMRTLSDRVKGRHRARLLGIVSRLLERVGDPRHEKLLESALLEAPESSVLLRRASELAEAAGDRSLLIERLTAELAQLADPSARLPREIKLAAALGKSSKAMEIARSLRERHPNEPGAVFFSLYIAETLGDPNEIAQALAAAIRAADSDRLRARLALRLAHHAEEGGQYSAAKAWADFALSRDPSLEAGFLIAIRAARRLEDPQALRESLLAWLSRLDGGPLRSALIQWGLRLNRALGGALSLSEALLEGESLVSAQRLRAELAIERGDLQAARDALRRLIRYAGPNEQAIALRDLAIFAAIDGDRSLAERALKEASYLEAGEEGHAAYLLSIIGKASPLRKGGRRDEPSEDEAGDPLALLTAALRSGNLEAAFHLAQGERFGGDPSLAMLRTSFAFWKRDEEAVAHSILREVETRPVGARAGALFLLALTSPRSVDLPAHLSDFGQEERADDVSLVCAALDAQSSGMPLSSRATQKAAARENTSPFESLRRVIRGELSHGEAIATPAFREILLLASRRWIPDALFDSSTTVNGHAASSDPFIRLAEAKRRAAEGDLKLGKERLIPADHPELRLALAEIELMEGETKRARLLLGELLENKKPSDESPQLPTLRAARLLEVVADAENDTECWLRALQAQLGALEPEELLVQLERALFELPLRGAFGLIRPDLLHSLAQGERAPLALFEMLEFGTRDARVLRDTLDLLAQRSAHPRVKRARLLRAADIALTLGEPDKADALQADAASIPLSPTVHETDDALKRGLDALDRALREGDVQAAEARYDALEFDHPNSPHIQLRRARILMAKERNEAAIQTLRELVGGELDDELRHESLLELASLFDRFRGDKLASISALEEALALKPDDPDTLCLLAPLKLVVGERDEARALFNRAIEAARTPVLRREERALYILRSLSTCVGALGLRSSAEMLSSLRDALRSEPEEQDIPTIVPLPEPSGALASDLIDAPHLAFFKAAQPAFAALAPFNPNALRLEGFDASVELKARLSKALCGPLPALYHCANPPSLVFAADPHGRRVVIHSELLDGLGTREFMFLCLSAIVRARLGVAFMDREDPDRVARLINAVFQAAAAPIPYPKHPIDRSLYDAASLAIAGEDPRIAEFARSAPRFPPVETLGLRLDELSFRLVLLSTGDVVGATNALRACARFTDTLPLAERLHVFALGRPAIERRHLLSRTVEIPSA